VRQPGPYGGGEDADVLADEQWREVKAAWIAEADLDVPHAVG